MKNVYSMLNNMKENVDDIELVEFSEVEERKYMKNFENNLKKENNLRKGAFRFNKAGIIVASLAVCVIVASTAYAKDITKFIIEKFSISGVVLSQDDDNIMLLGMENLTNLLIGKVYDENGNLYTKENFDLTEKYLMNSEVCKQIEAQIDKEKDSKKAKEMKEDIENAYRIYDKDGKEIMQVTTLDENGKVCDSINATNVRFDYENMIKVSYGSVDDNKYVILNSEKETQEYATFNVLVPTYLPEGYKFEEGKFLDSQELEARNYVFINYTNGDEIIRIHERKNTEEAAYETGANKVEYIQIQGKEAILGDDTIYVTLEDSICSVQGSSLTRDELIKVAESLTK